MIKIPKIKEEDLALRISNRFPYFKNTSIIINLSYEEFINDYNNSIKQIENVDFLDKAKELLQISKKNQMN